MDQMEHFENIEDQLNNLYHVARVEEVDGEKDFIAGQRDIIRVEYRLDLKASIVAKIEEEREESEEGISETLSGLRNKLELDFGLSPSDYNGGSLFVNAEYDNRPGGSM